MSYSRFSKTSIWYTYYNVNGLMTIMGHGDFSETQLRHDWGRHREKIQTTGDGYTDDQTIELDGHAKRFLLDKQLGTIEGMTDEEWQDTGDNCTV